MRGQPLKKKNMHKQSNKDSQPKNQQHKKRMTPDEGQRTANGEHSRRASRSLSPKAQNASQTSLRHALALPPPTPAPHSLLFKILQVRGPEPPSITPYSKDPQAEAEDESSVFSGADPSRLCRLCQAGPSSHSAGYSSFLWMLWSRIPTISLVLDTSNVLNDFGVIV